MKLKLSLCFALALSGGLFGCSTVTERPDAMSSVANAETYISQIQMIDARNGWAWSGGIDGSNLLLHTSNGGRTWRDCTPRGFSYCTAGCCFLDAQTAWVSTLDRKTYDGGLLHTTNGGESWSVLIQQGAASYGCFTEYSELHFFDVNNGVANTADGGAGSIDVCFYETHDGGKTWKPVNIIPPGGIPYANEPPGTIGLSDIAPETIGYCPPNIVITHGDMDDERPKDAVRLSVSTNLGKTLHELKLSLPSEKYREGLVECDTPVFSDDKNGWLPARIVKWNPNYTIAWNVMALYATHDGGATWAPMPGIIEGGTNFVGSYRQFDVVSSKDIFVCNGANLCVTHDGAKSWRMIKPNIDFDRTSSHGGVSQIDFVDATHGWAVVYDTFNHFPHEKFYLYKTSNGGKTWAEIPLKILH